MKTRIGAILLATASLFPTGVLASEYDRHVAFDNSLAPEALYYSETYVVAPSEFQVARNKVPVSTERFVSPPNSLKLSWTSRTGGDWGIQIKTRRPYGMPEFEGTTLAFWAYSEDELLPDETPRIGLSDSDGAGASQISLIGNLKSLPAGKWVRVRIPFSEFVGPVKDTREVKFNPARLNSIVIVQSLDDAAPHTLYIDDITIEDAPSASSTKPAAPQGLAAKGYDRHVDLTWTPVKSPNIRYYQIYRSEDGAKFTPVGIQKPHIARYADFVGASDKTMHYKITAVDASFNESAASTPVQAATRTMTDDELLTMVQEACFRYYWDGAHPNAGMAIEVTPGHPDLVAVGSSGFGIMAIVAGVERGFVTRDQGVERMLKIVRFINKADRFHGVWPHFLHGSTGKTYAYFGPNDNGGDLIETAFLVQGLLVARQYFTGKTPAETEIRDTITRLWREVEWTWYRDPKDPDFLLWHWSPTVGYRINHPLVGWNESMIAYLLGIASPTQAIPASMYHTGWAGQSDRAVRYRRGWGRTTQGDHYTNANTYYGIKLDVGVGNGAELFFTHFSFFAFDPRNKKDRYTNYFRNNRNINLIAHAYAIENPRKMVGYGDNAWGRSAGINSGGGRSLPRDDNGTLNVMASLASFPYTPEESMKALKHYYRDLGSLTWGVYGFRDGFNKTENWYEDVYMALNQAPIVIMIENHRTGLIWKLFMSNPEIAPALKAIGFVEDK